MRLTKLEALPVDRFSLTLEDGTVLRCGVQEVLDFGLRSGLDLEGETLERLREACAAWSVRQKAAALLAARPRLGRLVLDVWKNEPAVNRDLLAAADIATPHIAGYSIQGKINGTQAVVRAVGDFFDVPQLRNFLVRDVELPQIPYDIFADDAALRSHPENFERLRSNYSYRNDQLQ